MNPLRRLNFNEILNKLLLYGLIIYTFAMLGRAIWQNYQLEKETKSIKSAISQDEQHIQDLQNLILYYQSPSFQEVEARRELGLKKPGEKVVNIALKDAVGDYQSETQSQEQSVAETVPAPKPKANWQVWWDYFFKK